MQNASFAEISPHHKGRAGQWARPTKGDPTVPPVSKQIFPNGEVFTPQDRLTQIPPQSLAIPFPRRTSS